MPGAIARIVVQATPAEKKAITAKARRLGIPVSELMRRGAQGYSTRESEGELGALADAAKRAAERSGAAIEGALAYIDASNKRIAKMEAQHSIRKAG
ncbi:MAG TPA: hypothetical protein DHV08_02495 [Rhodocyclaceae bacterium]|nr:MAG: hypothetical protein AUK49_00475 [Betaproteobacteria bacterium CG2_30_68_42]PIX75971.1 MAG: hypothetical protein COZ38_02805 [Rhodocyclales bacterium CG_4_10_14_3_um_filter_68_10]PJA58461.1 MAG: hypothetical protein CO164_02435 [Rhodocyclales bacterium CG_4_9_14_3_um_filter_68_10]HCX32517.1 hypothetical protein [Rhodocyclaceae bacterium]